MNNQLIKDKLIDEEAELQDKISRLEIFEHSTEFGQLVSNHKDLLRIQKHSMKTYRGCLLMRIKLLEEIET